MNIQELAEAASKQINNNRDFLPLVLPQRKQQYEGYYMAGRNSPKGKSLGCVKGGELVHFSPTDVLAFCIAHGANVTCVMPSGDVHKGEELMREV